jgi:transcriptional regulator with AAA-type ATPase domain
MSDNLQSSQPGAVAFQQQYQQVLENPFLRDFALEGRGVIFYLVDLPFRSRDTNALALITRMLPATLSQIEFRPMLASQRWRFEESQIRDFCQRYADNLKSSKSMDNFKNMENVTSELDNLVNEMIKNLSKEIPKEYIPFDLPDKGPILIIGRPELFIPYRHEENHKPEWGLFHRLLEAAGYPGRYAFEKIDPFQSGFRVIRDGKTGLCYTSLRPPRSESESANDMPYDPMYRPGAPVLDSDSTRIAEYPILESDKRECEDFKKAIDYGIIFHSAVDIFVPRSVTIVVGCSALGTWAATLALTDLDVLRKLNMQDMEKATKPVEILVRTAVIPRPYQPLELSVSDLSIISANFSFRRHGEDVETLIRMFKGEVPSDEARKRFDALYKVTPDPEGKQYVIQVPACEYPLDEDVSVDGQPVVMVGGSEIQELINNIKKIAEDNEPVLITGPSGTGKELVAQLIYWYRCQYKIKKGLLKDDEIDEKTAFAPINCGAIPSELVETELFGQTKGAFTGAVERLGILRAAGDGVACLDEICELNYNLQSKLLRVLQPEDQEERKVKPVGADREQPYRAKIVALTNRDVLSEISARNFRADLHARFRHRLTLQPLRDRRMDIPALILSYLHRKNEVIQTVTIGEYALRVLLACDYHESNVRTLQYQYLDPLLWAHNKLVKRIALSDLPLPLREQVGMPADLEENTWFEFRVDASDVGPQTFTQELKRQIDSCPSEKLTADLVLYLIEQTSFRSVLEVLNSDQQANKTVEELAPLARLGAQKGLMNPKERKLLVDNLCTRWELTNSKIAILFDVHRSTVGHWREDP